MHLGYGSEKLQCKTIFTWYKVIILYFWFCIELDPPHLHTEHRAAITLPILLPIPKEWASRRNHFRLSSKSTSTLTCKHYTGNTF